MTIREVSYLQTVSYLAFQGNLLLTVNHSSHYKEKVRFEEMYYGVLVMVVCDSEGVVYDLWFHPASYHEVRSFRISYRKSKWLRFLVDSFGLMGDR